MAWHGMARPCSSPPPLQMCGVFHTDGFLFPMVMVMAMACIIHHFGGQEQAGRNWRIVCIDNWLFLSLFFFLSCSYFHITSHHSTLCIMYVCQPASQPALLRCATLPSLLLHVHVHSSTSERPPRLYRYCTSYSPRKLPAQSSSQRILPRNAFSPLPFLTGVVPPSPILIIYTCIVGSTIVSRDPVLRKERRRRLERVQVNRERAIM